MPYSDDELQHLYGDLAPTNNVVAEPDAEVLPPEEGVVPYKRLKQFANIIPRAIGSTAGSINELLSPGTGMAKESEDYLPTFDVGEDKGLGDVVLNEALPGIASWMIPYLGATKIGKAAGLLESGRVGAGVLEAIAQGGANAFTSVGHEGGTPMQSGALGAGSGFVQATLPRLQRILPLAAMGAAHVAMGGNTFEAGANLVGNLLPGMHGVTTPKLNPKPLQEIADALLPHQPEPNFSEFHPSLRPEGTFSFMNQVPENVPVGSREGLADLAPHYQEITLDQLNGPQLLREPFQHELKLTNNEPRVNELQLTENDFNPETINLVEPPNDVSLKLEGQELGQPDLHPLMTLQAERAAPVHSIQNPGEFRFVNTLDPMVDAAPKQTGSTLFDAPHVEAPSHGQPELNLASAKPKTLPETVIKAPDAAAFGKANNDAVTRAAMTAERDALAAKHAEMYAKDEMPLPSESHRVQMLTEALNWKQSKAQMKSVQAGAKAEEALLVLKNKYLHASEKYKQSIKHVGQEGAGLARSESKGLKGAETRAFRELKKAFKGTDQELIDFIQSTKKVPPGTAKEAKVRNMARGKAEAKAKREVAPQETPHERASRKLEEIELDPEAKKSQVIKHAEKLVKEGIIPQERLAEYKRIAKDRDMGVDDVASELKGDIEHSASKLAKPIVETRGPVAFRLESGKVISGEGNNPHFSLLDKMTDAESLTAERGWVTNETGRFLTPSEAEALTKEKLAKGKMFTAENIAEAEATGGKTPAEVKVKEKVQDAKALVVAKKAEVTLTDLYKKLDSAKLNLSLGDEGADIEVRGIKAAIEKMKKANKGEMGAISPELATVIALGGAGALVAYQQSKGDIGTTLAVATLAAGLGLGGTRAIKALSSSVGKASEHVNPKIRVQENLKAKITQLAKDTTQTPGGRAVFGRGGVWANAVRIAEGLVGFNGTPLFRDKKILADGFIAHQLEVLSKALDAAKGFKPSAGFSDAAAQFIRGQLVDKATVEATIRGGGGVDSLAYSKLDATGKKAYPEKWIAMDNPNNTNTKGPGVEVWHVSNATKTKLVEMQKAALKNLAHTKADKEFMQFPLQSRETLDLMMQVIHDALPEGAVRNKVLGTMGQYASRTHALLTDPNYYPTDVEVGRAMDRLAVLKEERFLDKHASATSIPGTVPITYKGSTHYVPTAAADEWANLHTPEALRSLVSQYIHEIKLVAAGKTSKLISKDSEQLGSSLFARRKELDEVTQALLGTHDAPLELIQHTFNKLAPTARSSHFMSNLIQMADERTGLQHAYKSEVAYNKAVNDIKHLLNSGVHPAEARALETKLQELSSYIPISGQSPRMGLFEGAYVSRTAHDQLAGFTNPFGLLDNAIGRGMSNFNQAIKETHLVMNPIVHVRNAIQIPMFLAMGNAAFDPAAWKGAYEAMKNPLSKLGKRLTENGVFSSNIVHGEFNHSIHELISGEADATIWGKIKAARSFSHKLYSAPDNFVRAAVYLAAEARAAKKFGVLADANDPRVMEEARLFMSRRTMDYANVAQIIKTGRQLPFVSMFLSYTSEIMRIGANLTQDALRGDLQAGATLGGLSALPFIAQSMAENQLKPEDRKAWDKTQNVVQDYSRMRFKLPMSRNADGTFNYLDLTPLMPFNDFQMTARAAMKGDYEAMGAINPFVGTEKTPLLSSFAEQITGKEIHSGKEFRNVGDRAWAIAREVLPPHTPGIGNEWRKALPEAVGGNLGVTNLRNARTNTIEGALSRHFAGVDITQVNPSIALKNYVAAAKRDIANERQYYMDTMLSAGISADAKKRATEKFVNAVQVITGHMQNRLQLQPAN